MKGKRLLMICNIIEKHHFSMHSLLKAITIPRNRAWAYNDAYLHWDSFALRSSKRSAM